MVEKLYFEKIYGWLWNKNKIYNKLNDLIIFIGVDKINYVFVYYIRLTVVYIFRRKKTLIDSPNSHVSHNTKRVKNIDKNMMRRKEQK